MSFETTHIFVQTLMWVFSISCVCIIIWAVVSTWKAGDTDTLIGAAIFVLFLFMNFMYSFIRK